METLLTIGEFAERCGLSRSALRFYDQTELLRPRLVDQDSGYRYYAPGQLERARLVRRLRDAEMPVGAVREYLAASSGRRRAMLHAHLESVRERASAVESVVDQLRGDLDLGQERDRARRCTVAPAEFARALRQVSFAVADPVVRVELGVVWVETKHDSLRLVATDSYRLAVRDLVPETIGSQPIRGVIEAGRARTIAAELRSADTLTLSQGEEGRITAEIDGHAIVVGGADERFPDYERILSDTPTGHQIALSRCAVERGLAGLPPRAGRLALCFEAERLRLRGLDREVTIAARWAGPPVQMVMDRRLFAEAVSAMVGPDLIIEASDPLRPLALRSADTGTFTVLTMPIRATGPD